MDRNISFREAASRLGNALAPRPSHSLGSRLTDPKPPGIACGVRVTPSYFAAALELYCNQLMTHKCALDYMAGRGFGRELLEHERIGFAAGGELVPYLAWRGNVVQPGSPRR